MTDSRDLPVSVKGFPAIERLLYRKDSLAKLKQNPFACQVGLRIARYIASSSKAMATEWRESMLPQFEDPTQLDGYFEDELDAATTLLKALVEPLEIMRNLKLLRPMGSSAEAAKPTRLESWRSELSLKNLQANLASLRAMYALPDQRGASSMRNLLGQEKQRLIDSLFDQAQTQMSSMPGSLETILETEAGHAASLELANSLHVLHDALRDALVEMGVSLGFNSQDGD